MDTGRSYSASRAWAPSRLTGWRGYRLRMDHRQTRLLDRRQALGALGALGLGAVAAACSSGSSTATGSAPSSDSAPSDSASTSSSESSSSTASASATACTLTPEVTEGPYYLDINDVRQDVTEGKPGAPLSLQITVVDASSCSPIDGAAVDIWHCDATGTYSGVQQSTGTTFLRGTQVTGADGSVSFKTIYPGWYQGRAVHIHMKVHVNDSVVHTGQLFFDDSLSDTVFANSPYNGRGTRDTRNADDMIYSQAGGSSAIVPVTANGNAYTGQVTVGVKHTASAT